MSWTKKLARLGLLQADSRNPERTPDMRELSDQDRAWLEWFVALPASDQNTVTAWARKGIKVTPDILSDIHAIDLAKAPSTTD